MTLHQTIVAAWTLMMVLSSKEPECITLLPLLPNKRKTYFVVFFHGPAGSVPWQVEAT